MKHPLTASERRGAVILAITAVLIIGCSFLIDSCSSSRAKIVKEKPEMEVLMRGDTLDLKEKERKQSRKKKGKSSKKSKEKKTYGRRSPLDEPV